MHVYRTRDEHFTRKIEKESGNIGIDKLQAIILFEAVFNWFLKIIFSKKLMGRAIEMNLLPKDVFAQQGTSAMEAILTQTLWCDVNCLQHRTFAVISAGLSQCFDSVGHAQCSLAPQGFVAPIKLIVFMLIALQIMNFWLKIHTEMLILLLAKLDHNHTWAWVKAVVVRIQDLL